MATRADDPKHGLFKTLSTPTYTITETSRLTGLSRYQVRRYLKGYSYEGGKQDPVITRDASPESTYASFLDLIDLLFVKRLLERGFSLQFIRKALDDARIHLGAPHFARSIFFTSRKDIVLQLPDSSELVTLLTGGQMAMNVVVDEFYKKLDFEKVTNFKFVRRWYPLGKKGLIVIDPTISFGRPTIMGSGIATENIYDLFLGEQKIFEPVESWFRIPRSHLEAAVNFELSLVA
jgi:DNA-binding transcriptional MerR regulator/uncharacterized protein (DUF433 family)